MNRRRLLLLSVLALAAAIPALDSLPAQPKLTAPLAARNSDSNGVRIVIRPTKLDPSQSWEFEVVMDTHSQPLDSDLTKAATLIDANGRRHASSGWQGDGPGGHHRKGTLRFPAIESTQAFAIELQDVGGKEIRTFQWGAR